MESEIRGFSHVSVIKATEALFNNITLWSSSTLLLIFFS